jgi:hypothetical protein
MKQAAEAHQVRLYGLYRIDPIILKSVKNVVKNKDDKNRMDLLKEIFRNKGKQRKIEIQISDNKEEEIKNYKKINKELEKEIDKLAEENKKLYTVLKTIPKKEDKEDKEDKEEEEDTLEDKPISKMTDLELRRILIRLRTRKQVALKNKKPFSKENDEKIAEASETLKGRKSKFSFEKEHEKITKELEDREEKRKKIMKTRSEMRLYEEHGKITKELKDREVAKKARDVVKQLLLNNQPIKKNVEEEPDIDFTEYYMIEGQFKKLSNNELLETKLKIVNSDKLSKANKQIVLTIIDGIIYQNKQKQNKKKKQIKKKIPK